MTDDVRLFGLPVRRDDRMPPGAVALLDERTGAWAAYAPGVGVISGSHPETDAALAALTDHPGGTDT